MRLPILRQADAKNVLLLDNALSVQEVFNTFRNNFLSNKPANWAEDTFLILSLNSSHNIVKARKLFDNINDDELKQYILETWISYGRRLQKLSNYATVSIEQAKYIQEAFIGFGGTVFLSGIGLLKWSAAYKAIAADLMLTWGVLTGIGIAMSLFKFSYIKQKLSLEHNIKDIEFAITRFRSRF